jgi:hypothetical protein
MARMLTEPTLAATNDSAVTGERHAIGAMDSFQGARRRSFDFRCPLLNIDLRQRLGRVEVNVVLHRRVGSPFGVT